MKKDLSQALSMVFIQKKTLAAYRDILIPSNLGSTDKESVTRLLSV